MAELYVLMFKIHRLERVVLARVKAYDIRTYIHKRYDYIINASFFTFTQVYRPHMLVTHTPCSMYTIVIKARI